VIRQPIVILGAGGHGRETALLLAQINAATPRWDVLGFLDDDTRRLGTTVAGLPVLGGLDVLPTLPAGTAVALGVGAPAAKRRLVAALPATTPLPVLVHPSVVLGERIALGDGTQLHAGTIATCDLVIGRGVTVNRRCDLSHDDRIGDFCTLAPAVTLAGDVHLADDVDVGIGVACTPGVRVGARTVIGAGAVVVHDLAPDVTAVGMPARPIAAGPGHPSPASRR
jgi:sugar O-acyltransferase (sialic acid O-acetyltransferase NeuD family)